MNACTMTERLERQNSKRFWLKFFSKEDVKWEVRLLKLVWDSSLNYRTIGRVVPLAHLAQYYLTGRLCNISC